MTRAVLRSLLLSTVASTAAVLLAESALRLSGVWISRHSDHMFSVIEEDANLGWRLKPNISATIDMFDTENIPIQTNSDGLWDLEFNHKKSDRIRVAFLGDSFTWGYGVHRGERFTDILPTLNRQYDSMNFGVPAYGTDQEVLMWEQVASRFSPAVVVLTIVPNDYADNRHSVLW